MILFFILSFADPVYAQEKEPDKDRISRQDSYDMALIFNTTDILLDVGSYQGGIGFKIGRDKLYFRMLFDFFLSNASNAFSISLGNSLEYHFLPGRVSPYFGGYLNLGFTYLKSEISPDTWTKLTSIPFSLGGIFGVEVFIFDFLSIFAEYSLGFNFDILLTEQSFLGAKTKTSELNYIFNTGIGNESKIGITIYFIRIMDYGDK